MRMVKGGGGDKRAARCPFADGRACDSDCALLIEFDLPVEIGKRFVCAFALPSRGDGRSIPLPFLARGDES